VELSEDGETVSVEVRIVRNSACCGDEMKEYTFNTDAEVPSDLLATMEAGWKKDPPAEYTAEEDSVDQLEEGGHRYKKSYFGYTMAVAIKDGDGKTVGTVEVTDKIEASGMDELN